MRPAFHCGPIQADPDLLAAIPRSAMISAIVRHATSQPIHGEAVVTHHEHDGRRFYLETTSDRQSTAIRLS